MRERFPALGSVTIPSSDLKHWLVRMDRGVMNISRVFVMFYELVVDNRGLGNLRDCSRRRVPSGGSASR